MRDILYVIDLVLISSVSNLPYYQINLTEHVELKQQVDKLVDKSFIRKSISHCAVSALLMPKKDGSWYMCVDSRTINRIIIKYCFSIPRLVDMLEMMSGATIFSKIDLKNSYHQILFIPKMNKKLLPR